LWACARRSPCATSHVNAFRAARVQAVMVEKNKPQVPGGMGAAGMPSGMTI
jgi:hypothetical protein